MHGRQNIKSISAEQLFVDTYVQEILESVINKFGASYENSANVKNTWLKKFNYSEEISNHLIFETKLFIRLLDSRQVSSTDPKYLRALVKLIANYLSIYFMRDPKFLAHEDAIEYLIHTLYDNNAYIQSLLKRRSENLVQKLGKKQNVICTKNPETVAKKLMDNKNVLVQINSVIQKKRLVLKQDRTK